jgi:hypothetical protein
MLDFRDNTIRSLKKKGYRLVREDKQGVYLQKGDTKVYVDEIGIFVYRFSHEQRRWIRESGHVFLNAPLAYI